MALAPAAPGDAFDATFDEEEDAIVFRRVRRASGWLNEKTDDSPMKELRQVAGGGIIRFSRFSRAKDANTPRECAAAGKLANPTARE